MKGSVLVTIFFSIWEKTLHDLFSQHKIYVRSFSKAVMVICISMLQYDHISSINISILWHTSGRSGPRWLILSAWELSPYGQGEAKDQSAKLTREKQPESGLAAELLQLGDGRGRRSCSVGTKKRRRRSSARGRVALVADLQSGRRGGAIPSGRLEGKLLLPFPLPDAIHYPSNGRYTCYLSQYIKVSPARNLRPR